MKLTKFQWYRAGMIFLLAVLIAAGLVLIKTTRRLKVALERESPMLETLTTIGRVRMLAREMEMIRPSPGTPRDAPAAVRYGNTVIDILAEMAELRKQTAGSQVQLERTVLLEEFIREQGGEADRSQQEPLDVANPMDFSGIWTILNRMEGDEKNAITAWREEVSAALVLPLAATIAGVIAAAAAAVFAYFLVLHELARRTSTERLLRESRLRFGILTDGAKEYTLIVLDASGRVVDWNTGSERMFGYRAGEISRKHFSKLFPQEQVNRRVPEQCLKTAVHEGQIRDEGIMIRQDASSFPVREIIHALWDDAGRLNGFAAIVQDITEERRLQEEMSKLVLSLEHSTDLVAITKADGTIEYVNLALLEKTGYSREELAGSQLDVLRPAGAKPLAGDHNIEGQSSIIRKKNGEQLQVSQSIAPVIDRTGRTTHLVITSKDVTTQRHLESRLAFLSHHDTLTDLFNRSYFNLQAKKEIDRGASGSGRIAVLIINIDRFKHINDVFGNNAGNLVLKQVAECLHKVVGTRGVIGRLGSDEFGIVLRDVTGPGDVSAIISAVKGQVARRVAVNGRKLFLTLSAGAALHPSDGTDAEMLLKNADVALIHAKSNGLNQVRMYSTEINDRMSTHMAMEQQLFSALQNNEYTVTYQPYFELTHRKLAGAEALIRWVNRELGTISPARFIKALENTGLIIDVGNWVLKTTCLQAKKMENTRHRFPLSVNLSPSQFRHNGLVDMVKGTIGEIDIDPGRLTIEVTESVFVEDFDFAQSVLKQLKNVGVAISIDDFGTGYSSLSFLKKLPVDAVKIDQSFVRDVTSDPDTASIVTSITSMARSLGLKTIAEGVETETQWKVLRLLHCDMGQGFFFSPAMNAEDFERSLV